MIFDFHDSRLWPYYPKILLNQVKFYKRLYKVRRIEDSEAKLKEISDLAHFSAFGVTGTRSSWDLEKMLIEESAKLPKIECNPQKKSILHVFTSLGEDGGHTRVADRWIQSSPKDEMHSVVITDQPPSRIIPSWLKDSVRQYNGELTLIDGTSIIEKAIKLREIASRYERIILYIYWNDVSGYLAFADNSFTNPVIYFNHADHIFWLGVGIADIVADLQDNNISELYRKASKSTYLGIPVDTDKILVETHDKKAIRKELGISEDDFVYITCGNPRKYTSIYNISIIDIYKKLSQQENTTCLAIGPSEEIPEWKELSSETGGKCKAIGVISNKSLLYKYFIASDLYIGSIPIMSYTAIMDAIQCGLPFIQYRINIQYDYSPFTDVNVPDCSVKFYDELIERAIRASKDHNYLNLLREQSNKWLENYSSSTDWIHRRDNLYKQTPSKHSVHKFKSGFISSIHIDDRMALNLIMYGGKYGNKWINKVINLVSLIIKL